MSKFNKYRIVEFPYNGKSVFRAEKKVWFFWRALDYEGMGFHRLNNIPDFQRTKEESLKLIEEDKAKMVARAQADRKEREFAKKFGPVKYYCAD